MQKRKKFASRVKRSRCEMWVNAAKERKLGHAQLCWCVYGIFADEENYVALNKFLGLLRCHCV